MRKFLLSFLLFLCLLPLSAGEGMWLPILLKSLNAEEMEAMGMEISVEDIYSVNQGSLKDAIVHFGGFCTGEVISPSGLLLTNHHCGYDAIQSHSTLDNNYLENGFWATDPSKELNNPDLYVTFIVSMEDVTRSALEGVDPKMKERDRQSLIDQNLAAIRDGNQREDWQDVVIRPFYKGNRYFLFVTETYRDVRLVGAPPSSIGKFGADTDNWEWPRHTGDFSLFRIYTDPDGRPAEYAPENIPMKSRHHLPVSTSGVKEGDFTMVFGFPGRTDLYLPTTAVEIKTEVINPIRINMRDSSLSVIDRFMRNDPAIKIQYASKQARIANAWKKWKGESHGIATTGAIEKKRILEREFILKVRNKPQLEKAYGKVLEQLERAHRARQPFDESRAYVAELNYNIDLFRLANKLSRLPSILSASGEAGLSEYLPEIDKYLAEFYKNYRPEVDQAVTQKLLPLYFVGVTPKHQSEYARDQRSFAGSTEQLVNDLFTRSYLTDGSRALPLLRSNPVAFVQQLEGDPGYQFVLQLNEDTDRQVNRLYREYENRIQLLQRNYMAGLMATFHEKRFYPDANSTLRLSYGRAEGYANNEGEQQHYVTYLDGVMEKYVPGDYEFDLPEDLRTLYELKDFGRWTDDTGKVPVCFLGSNHTTGGNSGSPVINGKGELVGLNFDRVKEGTMSDLYYDPNICRNIMVDIRYILFLIEKLGQAPYLIEEMSLR